MASPKTDWKKIFKFDKTFSKQLAIDIKGWVLRDMIAGRLQGAQRKYSQKRKRPGQKIYVDYKANLMNRFTNKSGPGTKGTKLLSMKGVSARSIHVSSVNMYLTGHLIDGLGYDSNTKTSLTMTFGLSDDEDSDAATKLRNNEALGRDVRTLNKANQKKVKTQIIKQFDKNKRKHLKKNITINIGK